MSDLSTLLAELDAAVAKMTPGPWTNSEDGYIETGPRTNTYQLLPETEDGPAWDDEAIADATGIVALVNAYPALREAIEQAIKTQQHMDETLRPLVEELRKAAHQARARETEACAEAARLRTECDEQAAIASNAVTKGAAYALENERLRAERDQLSEIIDTWGFAWMEEREAWQREREQEAVQREAVRSGGAP